jgi:ribosomal protein L15
MPHAAAKRTLIMALALLLATGEAAFAKKMYRWVDENGNVYFSDQVPPDQVQHKRETLSEKARVLDVLEKAKTAEQLAQQKRLDALRKEQEKIIAKQNANDKVLLSTFRSIDDMNKALSNKMASFDAARKVIEGNIERFEQQLQQQQQQAANLERNGTKIPPKLLADIAASKQQIESGKQELIRHQQDRQNSEKEFKADIARFQFLTQSNSDGKPVNGDTLAASNASNDLGLFVCQDAAQCEKAWKIAGEFVATNSTTGQDVESEKLIMRAAPQKDDDLSLSVSLLERNNSQQIFLDIRCRQSSIGNELCAGPKAQSIRQAFAPFIQSSLAAQQ